MRRFPSRALQRVLRPNFFTLRKNTSEAKKEASLPPGTMVYVGEERTGKSEISLVAYTTEFVDDFKEQDLDELMAHVKKDQVTWVNIDGIHDISLINEVSERFQLHPLTREDIVNTMQIPKAEVYENYQFYALLDIIASHYLIAINHLARQIDTLEEGMADQPGASHLANIAEFRKTLLYLRRYVAPLRDQVLLLQRGHSSLIRHKIKPYFQDLQDLLTQALADIDTYRDILKNLSDQNLALSSYRMNEVMKVLTIVSTVFIPLSFIVGLYGMNFAHMPELDWKYGYPMVWGVMILATGGMLVYFRVKKWM